MCGWRRSPDEGQPVVYCCGVLWYRSRGQLSNSTTAVSTSAAYPRGVEAIAELALWPCPCGRGERSCATVWLHLVHHKWCMYIHKQVRSSWSIIDHTLQCHSYRCASILPSNQPSFTCLTVAKPCTTICSGQTGTPRHCHTLLSLGTVSVATMKG